MFFGTSRQRKILQYPQIDIAEPGIHTAKPFSYLATVRAQVIILPDKSFKGRCIARSIETYLVRVGCVRRNINQIVGETISVNIAGISIRIPVTAGACKSIPFG